MALKGDTSNLLLADIFQTLSQNGQLGLLHLSGEGEEHRILFSQRGITAFDARAFKAERLGELLKKSGRVGRSALRKALQETRRSSDEAFSSVPLLCMLDEADALSLDDGAAILRSEVLEELFEVFDLQKMEFEFDDGEVPVEGIPPQCFFRTEEIVFEAARRLDEQQLIRQFLGDGDSHWILVDKSPEDINQEVAELLDGRSTPLDISERLLASRFEVRREVARLAERDLLRPPTSDELISFARDLDPAEEPEWATRLLQVARSRLKPDDPRLDEIGELLVRVRAVTAAVSVLLVRARSLLADGNPETAYSQVIRARDLDPNHSGVLETLADIHEARGETDAEVKVLTSLAERAAATDRFEKAVEYGTRAAAKNPEAPLLDRAFVIYCQKAGMEKHGAEVLSQAAEERSKQRASTLFEAILQLDPTRTDVKRELARIKLRKNRIRAAWIMAGVIAFASVVWLVVSLFGRMADERLRGRLDSAMQLVERGEGRLAEAELVEILPRIEDEDDRLAAERLLGRAREMLREVLTAERSKRDDTIRNELNDVVEAVEDWRFSDAVLLVRRLEEEPTANAAVKGLLKTRANSVTVGLQDAHDSIATLAAKFVEPDDDSRLEEVMQKYGEEFSSKRLAEMGALLDALTDVPAHSVIQDVERLRSLASACLTVLERVRPAMDSIEARLSRNEALDVLSDDYLEIEAAERDGEFARAASGYERLLRGYGNGPLRGSFEERQRATARAGEVLAEVTLLLENGGYTDAQERVRNLSSELPELDVASRVGFPVRISSVPTGATLRANGRHLGITPAVVWAKAGADLRVAVTSPGFGTEELVVTTDAAPEVSLDLPREARFDVLLDAPVQVDALPLAGHVLAGGRSGKLLLISLKDGRVTKTVDTNSLMGIAVPPVRVGDCILVATGEGDLLTFDAETLAPRGQAKLDEPPVARPWAGSDSFLVAQRSGAIHRVDEEGRATRIASVVGPLRAGPVERAGRIAVGRPDGSVVILRDDGAIAFTTAVRPTPVIGLVVAGDHFVAADDSGTLFGIAPATGQIVWERSLGDASAAPPVSSADAVIFAAGRRAYVLDGATGESRLEVEVDDWASAGPTLAGGRLYVTDRSAHLSVFDFSTGELLFRHLFDDVPEAAALVVPEGVLVLTRDGHAALLGA